MWASIKSEYRKLLTIRSTYVIFAFLLVFIGGFFAFYAQGTKASALDAASADSIAQAIVNGTSIVGAIAGIIGLLMVSHEYRYNTIMYTLTASNSRAKSLFAKIFVLTTVSAFLTLLFVAIIPPLIHAGMSVSHHTTVPQVIYYKDLIWQCMLSAWANMMYAVLLSIFIRHQVGAVAAYFVIPTTVENLLGILLKDNAVYLPFSIAGAISSHASDIPPTRAALVALAYIVGGSIIAFITFKKRDAN